MHNFHYTTVVNRPTDRPPSASSWAIMLPSPVYLSLRVFSVLTHWVSVFCCRDILPFEYRRFNDTKLNKDKWTIVTSTRLTMDTGNTLVAIILKRCDFYVNSGVADDARAHKPNASLNPPSAPPNASQRLCRPAIDSVTIIFVFSQCNYILLTGVMGNYFKKPQKTGWSQAGFIFVLIFIRIRPMDQLIR